MITITVVFEDDIENRGLRILLSPERLSGRSTGPSVNLGPTTQLAGSCVASTPSSARRLATKPGFP